MWGIYSYLISILIFAGLVVIFEIIFGFHFFKKYLKAIGFVVLISLILTSLGESAAHNLRLWIYNPERTFSQTLFGAEIESYLWTFFSIIAVSCAVIIWTTYEDEGKNILIQSFKDIFKGTYAIWRSKK